MAAGAATHVGGSVHSSSSISPPPPLWHPVVLVPSHHHHHQVLYDLGTPSPSPFPSPTTPAATASPPAPGHSHLRPAASSRQRARAGKPPRRPRPSRKQPTTYISADAASFRRMVHQVTGADDDDALLLHLHGHGGPAASAPERLLCRQAQAPPRSRAGLMTTTTETLVLPTLDTSAFLMLGAAADGDASRGGAALARRPGASCRYGSSVVVVDPGAPALQVKAEEEACGDGGGGGFRSLEWWYDEDDALL